MRTLSLALIVAASLHVGIACAEPNLSDQTDRKSHRVSGVIEQLDRIDATIKIKTELEKAVFIEFVRPDLLQGLTEGDRVFVELDDRGRGIKITKVGIPELKEPLPSAK